MSCPAVSQYQVKPRTTGVSNEPLWFLPGDVGIFGTASDAWVHAVISVYGDASHYAQCASHTPDTSITTIPYFFSVNPTWTQCTYYDLVDATQPASTHFAAGDTLTVTASAVKMRNGPSYGAATVNGSESTALLHSGDVVTVLSDPQNGKAYNGHHWWKMQFGTYVGWCAGDDTAGNWWFVQAALPNLTPYQPSGWSDKIVVSNRTGTNTDDSPLLSTDSLYVDWSVINNGAAPTSATFYSDLYVDGNQISRWYTSPPLAVGSSAYVQDYSLGSLSAGPHTLQIVVDSTGTINESNEGDNSYTKPITIVPPSPDLSWNSLSVSPTTLTTSGGSLTATRNYQVSNATVGSAFTIEYRLSTNTTWGDGDDVVLTPDESISSGQGVGGHSGTFTVSVGSIAAGTYYSLAKVDNGNSVTESNETNNVVVGNQVTVNPLSADLSWNSLSVAPTTLSTAGGNLTATRDFQVSNATVGSAFTIQYRLSSNTTWGDGDDVVLTPDENISSGQAVGGHSGTFTVSVGSIAAGTYYALGKVDNGNAVTESDETNNVVVGNQVTITALPDLSWNSLNMAPTTLPTTGGSLTATRNYQVSNATVGSAFTIQYRLSTNTTWGDGDDIVLTPDENISSGQGVGGHSGTFTVSVGSIAAGTYYTLAKVDNGSAVTESNETNNVVVGNQVTVNPLSPKIDAELIATSTPTAQDAAGTLPQSLNSIPQGQTFYVEVWAKDIDGSANGITGGDLSFSFDKAKVTGGTISHGTIFTTLTGGSVDNAAGMVTDLAGNVSPGDNSEGVSQWVRLGYVSFTPSAQGIAAFTAVAGIDQFARASEGAIPWANVRLNETPLTVTVFRCIYDIDNSGSIGNGDYSYLSTAWHTHSTDAKWDARCDFDRDGFIGNSDFSWLSTNWHKNADDPTIVYPPGTLSAAALGSSSVASLSAAPYEIVPLTVAAIDVELLPVGAPTSSDTAATLPAPLTHVNSVGDSFYVEVWAKDIDGSADGITGGDLTFSFDKTKVTGGTINHGSIFTTLTGGSVDNAAGMVTDLAGNASPGDISEGVSQWVRLGYVSFTASAQGTAPFNAIPGSDQFARAGEGGIPWTNVQLNASPASVTIGSPTSFLGTSGDDTFTFTVGSTWHQVVVTLSGGSPTTYRYPASENTNITFDGLGGNDSVTLTGGPGDETVELYPDHGTLAGGNYSVSVSNVESITATNGGGNDQAILHDGPQPDTFIGSPTYAILFGPGVWLRANGFRSVVASATPAGQDVARLFDSAGNDAFTAYPTDAVLTDGTTYSIRANDFGFVMAYANQGGTDAASFFDSPGNDTFATTPTLGTMTGKWRPEGAPADRSYYNRGEGFDSYEATSTAGEDLARLTDSPTGDDRFVAEPTWATLSGSGLSSRANGFRYVVAYATGGNDTAQLKHSPGTDTFVATPAYGVMYASASALNPAYLNRAGGFDQVEALSQNGGDDSARLYDSAGDDNFTAYPTYALLSNDPSNPTAYSNKATGFRYAHAYANSGGFDKATLTDSSGFDTLEARPTYSVLSNSTPGQAFYNRANYFDQVVAVSGGIGGDIARLYDSAGSEAFQASPTSATLSGAGFSYQAQNFRYVLAYATTGGDEAFLTDSAGNDTFTGTPTSARLTNGTSYYVEAKQFPKVTAFSTGGDDTANLYDGSANDYFWGHLGAAVLTDGTVDNTTGDLVTPSTYYYKVYGFDSAASDRVHLWGTSGGTNTKKVITPLDYVLATYGTWIDAP